MTIIGHPWIVSEHFVTVDSMEKIKKSPAGSILLFDDLAVSIELVHYCKREGLPFALRAEEAKTALFAHALNARYIITGREAAKAIQKLAQHYLFDTQILIKISDESEIETYAGMGLDGVIFPAAIE
ncbi:MAG: hypothetical protein U9R26_02275 [Campylobacterota bacterium]|nr:hypothetical protein [Campylobacterota bacterium]